MAYDNNNSGMLRKNDRRKSDQDPDYRGFINVGGTEYWLSAWIRVAGEGSKMAGEKFMSLSLQPRDDSGERRPARPSAPTPRAAAPARRSNTGTGFDQMADEIPF